ncbi:MAG: N-acetylmuramoyl-L-alanine amidase [Chlamydiota bacterium]|nr:N-acetylmuramoyl-L-alanine amidase [Chlamydiota bacterium]
MMKKSFFLNFAILLLLTICLSPVTHSLAEPNKKVASMTVGNLDYVYLNELGKLFGLAEKWDPKSDIVTLERQGIVLSFRTGSAFANLNKNIEKMPDIARLIHGRLAIPLSFGLVKIEPFAAIKKPKKPQKTNIIPKNRIFRLVLDPGHGGNDPGTIGQKGTKEKDIVLDICKRIRRQLKASGIEITMTRSSDKFVSLWHRNYVSRKIGPDLFVSIHANAADNKTIYGIETYYARDANISNNGKNYKKNYSLSYYFANLVQVNLCNTLVAKNRRVKKANYFVLKNATVPSVLIETGFLSHHWEERKLKNETYRDRIAHVIAKCILSYKRKVGK